MIASLIRAQLAHLAQRWRARPLEVLIALLLLLALYLTTAVLGLPKAAAALTHTYDMVLQARGQRSATFFVAILQLVLNLALIGPILMQGAHLLRHSPLFRLYHQRFRDPRRLVTALQLELGLTLLAVLALLAPLSWGPFLTKLPGPELVLLALFQLCLGSLTLALFPPYLALVHCTAHSERGESLRWVVALSYYLILAALVKLGYPTIIAPARDQPLVALMRGLHTLFQPSHSWLLPWIALLLLTCAHGGRHLCARAIRSYGF